MVPFRGFIAGFTLGFGSGVVFRILAENEFEPVKDIFKTSVGIAQKSSDVVSETFGRLMENFSDLRSQLKANQANQHMSKSSHSESRGRKKSAKKEKSRGRMHERELHA